MTQFSCKRCGLRLYYQTTASGDGYGVGVYTRWFSFDDEDQTCTDQFGKEDTHRPDRSNQTQALNDFVEWLDRQVKEESEANEWVEPS